MKGLAAILAFAFLLPAQAQSVAPDAVMRHIAEEVVASFKADKTLYSDEKRLAVLVEEKLLPHFNFRRAAQLAMGVHWRRMTPAQQEALTREFRILLVRTYTGALSKYRGHGIEFLQTRVAPGEREVTVRSQVKNTGALPIQIEYDMERNAATWKVYDVRISGVSLVANYRTRFAEDVRNIGVDGLIASLAAQNRAAAAPRTAKP